MLRTFLDLIESRNFNRTAERLNVTQSTISNRIQALEREIGVVLFERGRGGATPTAAGRRFIQHARQIMASWSHALHDIGMRGTHARILRLSGQHSLQSSLLVDWAVSIRGRNDHLAIDLQSDYSEQIMRDVTNGDTDIGVMFAPEMHADVRVRKEGELVFRMMSTDIQNLSDVDPAKYYFVGYTDAFSRAHEEVLPEYSANSYSVGNETLAINLMSKLGGTAYLPDSVVGARDVPHLMRVADAPDITLPVYSVIHRNKRSDHDVSKSLEILSLLLT